MTEIPYRKTFASRQTLGDADAWGKMMALAAMIEIDEATGAIRSGMVSHRLLCGRMAGYCAGSENTTNG